MSSNVCSAPDNLTFIAATSSYLTSFAIAVHTTSTDYIAQLQWPVSDPSFLATVTTDPS